MSKGKVLFIDDDIALGNIVTAVLTDEGYEVHQQNSLRGIKGIISEFKPGILILDIEIGTEDAIDKMPGLHLMAPDLPVIVISSHKEEKEVVRALRNKAVAYLRKPFGVEELMAYLERYINPAAPSPLTIASLELDAVTRILSQDGKEVKKLSKLEFALLSLLYEHCNAAVSREEIYGLWENAAEVENHSLYNLISKLKNVLSVDANIVISKSGDGYVLRIHS